MKKVFIGLFVVVSVVVIAFVNIYPRAKEALKPLGRTEPILILRDIVIATYAHHRAGDPITPEEGEIDYIDANLYSLPYTWGIESNSKYLAGLVRQIVPMFEYEHVSPVRMAKYPSRIVFVPYHGRDHIHKLGTAGSGDVHINERLILRPDGPDERAILSTVVHELVHVQEGRFSGFAWGAVIEAPTQAATIEVLAAMCHYRNEVACKAFWGEIEDYARGALWMRLRLIGAEDLYFPLADLLWRDADDELAGDKSRRYWYQDWDHQGYLYSILFSYSKKPWEEFVIGGVCGVPMDTGHDIIDLDHPQEGVMKDLVMEFDDTRALLGKWLTKWICSMPYGEGVW